MIPLLAATLVKPNPAFITLISTLAIPLVVGFITKKHASSAVKALTNAAIVSIVAALTLASTHGLTPRALATLIVMGFITSSGVHEFLWKNLGVSDAVANLLPGIGLGADLGASNGPAPATPAPLATLTTLSTPATLGRFDPAVWSATTGSSVTPSTIGDSSAITAGIMSGTASSFGDGIPVQTDNRSRPEDGIQPEELAAIDQGPVKP